MSIPYSLVQSDDVAGLTAIINGKVYSIEKSHPNWQALVTGVTTADDDTDLDALVRLFDPAEQVQDFFQKVSERVSVAGGHVFFDGEEVNDGLSNHIMTQIREGNDPEPFVNFMEKVYTNPNEHSREQLFDWLSRHDFAINAAGNFLAYKGVRSRSRVGYSGGATPLDPGELEKYPYESISTGTAIVDGQTFTGAIPNGVGAVVEMPRGAVQHDPSVGCHTGLHAGTYEYASGFSQGTLLLVEINPRDVVSVPTDCSWQKIRTCRYTVKEVIQAKLTSSFYDEEDDEELDEDYSYDDPYEGEEEDSWNGW